MSLFGTSPDESTKNPSASLFEDRPTPGADESQSSLFADDNPDNVGSPWHLPTPKKPSRAELVKSILSPSDVPEFYVDTFDALLDSDKQGTGVSLTGVRKVLEASGLPAEVQSRILNIVLPEGLENYESTADGLGQGQINVLLALIGLAQENDDVTLDSVDERKRNLPVPSLPSLSRTGEHHPRESSGAATPRMTKNSDDPSTMETPARSRARQDDSLNDPESDPWSSPALHKGHNHPEQGEPNRKPNGTSDSRSKPSGPEPSSSGRREDATDSGIAHPHSSYDVPQRNALNRRDSAGWNSYEGSTINAFSTPVESGIGAEGPAQGNHNSRGPRRSSALGRAAGAGRASGGDTNEVVMVTLLPEKEGVFMFQHRNYEVSSRRRGAKVVRRYSDFVWLLSCLLKRYPFRQLPLLPPKRVAVNGNHILSDASFLEKRRRGLGRFANALVRHPVLSQEQLVVMFLTVPTELAVWRKQATISVQEEFTGKSLPPTLEDSLPPNLMETFDTVRSGVRRSLDIYMNLCGLLDRLARRNEGIAADFLRLSLGLQSLAEVSESTYAVDTNDVPLLNTGLQATAKHLSTGQSLLEDEAKTWDDGILEDLKRQRDTLVSVRDMFDRRDRLAKNNIPALDKRIQNNETKLAGLRSRPEGTVKPGELEKLEDAIIQDKQSIVAQHARGVFIKECIRDELNHFQSSQYHVSRLHQDWSQERVKYAELQSENWRSLSEEVESMPVGE